MISHMSDLLTPTAIAALAFLQQLLTTEAGKTFVEGIFKKFGEETAKAGLAASNALRQAIWDKLRGNSQTHPVFESAEQADITAVETLAEYLQQAMTEDGNFSEQVQNLAKQVLHIGKIEGHNVQNIYDGQGLQVNDPKAPTIQAGENATFTFNYGKDP